MLCDCELLSHALNLLGFHWKTDNVKALIREGGAQALIPRSIFNPSDAGAFQKSLGSTWDWSGSFSRSSTSPPHHLPILLNYHWLEVKDAFSKNSGQVSKFSLESWEISVLIYFI